MLSVVFIPRHLVEDVASCHRFDGALDELLADETLTVRGGRVLAFALHAFAGRYDPTAVLEPLPCVP